MTLKIVNRFTLLKRFQDEVEPDHIKWDHDAGHAYSYIDHPVMRLIDYLDDEWLLDQTSEWLYENDYHNKPPCCIHIYSNGRTASRCGCHDDAGYTQEEIDGIVQELENYSKTNNTSMKYLVTRD
ncbi:MAG: hypothetical protein ACXABY_18510 [Candidatus Thorarchaeota archaeon]|jgi:hypothetical protein